MEIMRDSRLGTFGAAALFLVLLLKIAALSQLPFMLALAALPVAHGASRLSAVIVIATSRYARAEGIAKPVAKGIGAAPLVVATLTGIAAVAIGATILGPAPCYAAWPALPSAISRRGCSSSASLAAIRAIASARCSRSAKSASILA